MPLSADQIVGLRNRVGDALDDKQELTDTRIQAMYTDAVLSVIGNPLTRTIVMMLEELVGRASIQVSASGDFGQQMNDSLFARRMDMLKSYRMQLEAEIKAGVTVASIIGDGFGATPQTSSGTGVFVFPMNELEP